WHSVVSGVLNSWETVETKSVLSRATASSLDTACPMKQVPVRIRTRRTPIPARRRLRRVPNVSTSSPVLKAWIVHGNAVSGASLMAGRAPARGDVPNTEWPSESVSATSTWRLSRRGLISDSHSDLRYSASATKPTVLFPSLFHCNNNAPDAAGRSRRAEPASRSPVPCCQSHSTPSIRAARLLTVASSGSHCCSSWDNAVYVAADIIQRPEFNSSLNECAAVRKAASSFCCSSV